MRPRDIAERFEPLIHFRNGVEPALRFIDDRANSAGGVCCQTPKDVALAPFAIDLQKIAMSSVSHLAKNCSDGACLYGHRFVRMTVVHAVTADIARVEK